MDSTTSGGHHFRRTVHVPFYECDDGQMCQIPPKGFSYDINGIVFAESKILLSGTNHHSTAFRKTGEVLHYGIDHTNTPTVDKDNTFTNNGITYRQLAALELSDDLGATAYHSNDKINIMAIELQSLKRLDEIELGLPRVQVKRAKIDSSPQKKEIYVLAPDENDSWLVSRFHYEIDGRRITLDTAETVQIDQQLSRTVLSIEGLWSDLDGSLFCLMKTQRDTGKYNLTIYKHSQDDPSSCGYLHVFENIPIRNSVFMPERFLGMYADGGHALYIVNAVSGYFHPGEKRWIGTTHIQTKMVSKDLTSSSIVDINSFNRTNEAWLTTAISGDSRYIYYSGVTDRGTISPFQSSNPVAGFYPNHHYPFVHAFDRYTGASIGLHSIPFHMDEREVWSQCKIAAQDDSFILVGFLAAKYNPTYPRTDDPPEDNEQWSFSVRRFKTTGVPTDV